MMIGFKTVKQGQRIAVWNRGGGVRFVDGPRRLWLFREAVEYIDHFSVNHDQYLQVHFQDGHVEHIAGPGEYWFDPVKHAAIEYADKFVVKPDQAVTVYQTVKPEDAEEGVPPEVKRRVIHGPAQLTPAPNETIELIGPKAHYSAASDSYLVVHFRDGRAMHIKGPADMWLDPIEHDSIAVKPLLPLDANEAVVIYKRHHQADDKQTVERQILRGPAQYMPEPDEWLHEFSWHGADPKDKRRKVPHRLKFQKLRVIPDQMYFDVRDVRTADDALIVVQVMIFFELLDIKTMLDQTHDPIADFINAVTADVIDFAAKRTFEQFKRDTEQLNHLDSYLNVSTRAKRIGYQINKVVYRGYEANPKLQAMHDNAIEMRTSLQLENETERQSQELADLKLTREAERANRRQQMEADRVVHEQHMKGLQHEQKMKQQVAEHQQKLTFQKESKELALKHLQARNNEKAALLKAMSDMQIDLTRYLVAQYQHPDRLIRIDGGKDAIKPQLHMYEKDDESRGGYD